MTGHCEHLKTTMWEPHLAGARKCLNCGMVYNPNWNPEWQFELPPIEDRYSEALKEIESLKKENEQLKKALQRQYE